MTFDQLLHLNDPGELEAMSDAQLLEYLAQCLVDCPPIDIQLLNQEKEKIEAEKLKVREEKAKIKQEERLAKLTEKLQQKKETGLDKTTIKLSDIEKLKAQMEETLRMQREAVNGKEKV